MIFGYKDLQVQMYYTAAKLNTYMGMTYKDKVTPEKDDGLTVSIYASLEVKCVNPLHVSLVCFRRKLGVFP